MKISFSKNQMNIPLGSLSFSLSRGITINSQATYFVSPNLLAQAVNFSLTTHKLLGLRPSLQPTVAVATAATAATTSTVATAAAATAATVAALMGMALRS